MLFHKLDVYHLISESKIRIMLGCLVFLHTCWVLIHLYLVSNDLINPWKLGGYGMYTTANPRPVIQVYDMRFGGVVIPPQNIIIDKFYEKYYRLSFRCMHIPDDAIIAFVEDNPNYKGVPIQVFVVEKVLKKNPIRAEWVPSTALGIRWIGDNIFAFAAKTCGENYRGEFNLRGS